jgi:hypothetical protein
MENVHRCSSRVKHPTTRPLNMGQICWRRAAYLGGLGIAYQSPAGLNNRGYTGI